MGSAEMHNSKQGGFFCFVFLSRGVVICMQIASLPQPYFAQISMGSIVICGSVSFYNNKYSQPNSVLLCINS